MNPDERGSKRRSLLNFLYDCAVLAVLLFTAFFAPPERDTAIVIFLVLFLFYIVVAIVARFWKLLMRYRFVVLCVSIGVAMVFYRFYTVEGILWSYGVRFNRDAANFDSQALNEIDFWFVGKQGKLTGPTMYDDALFVGKPYRTEEGCLEFVVKSSVYPDRDRVRIQLLSPPQGGRAFRVVENTISVNYSLQKGLWSYP